MNNTKADNLIDQSLAVLAQEILDALAERFPVCMSSDEFHFFPQHRPDQPKWANWDDFSTVGLAAVLVDIEKWQLQLQQWRPHQLGPAAAVDLEMLARVLVTIQEQLELVGPHQSQPTFYLTIISMGLAEALEVSSEAFGQRMTTMPAFLNAAMENLQHVPVLHHELGMAMAHKLKHWIEGLSFAAEERRTAQKALDDFSDHLKGLETTVDFLLPKRIYARVADHHMGCGMGLDEIGWHLNQEIEEAEYLLAQSATRINKGKPWPKVWQELPSPLSGENDTVGFYGNVIAKLKAHCIEQRFFDPEMIRDNGVTVQTIPAHLTPIRANAAYSMPPGHPPKGGTFYIQPTGSQRIPRGLMLLAAHETYPGHHLLDTLRWQLDNPLRRSLEFPVFYEGWACFAEEILFDTDLFSGPVDRLLLAKRRYWRAQRGLADLRIHTGQCGIAEAAEALGQKGLISQEQALAMVQRYALKPGYQLAYTIGRRKFRQLYTSFLGRGKTPAQFVRKILAEGEIGFDRLAEKLIYLT